MHHLMIFEVIMPYEAGKIVLATPAERPGRPLGFGH